MAQEAGSDNLPIVVPLRNMMIVDCDCGPQCAATGGGSCVNQTAPSGPCGQSVCGANYCSDNESAASCPADCAAACGDGNCSPVENGKSPSADQKNCPVDCPLPPTPVCVPPINPCGDGQCNFPTEDAINCWQDCPGADGLGCPPLGICACGDGICGKIEASGTEMENSCWKDCVPAFDHRSMASICGDGMCADTEGALRCPKDCGPECGDNKCMAGEAGPAGSCPKDCTKCGNGACDTRAESETSCPCDCPPSVCGDAMCESGDGGAILCPIDCSSACGNNLCEASETRAACPEDCVGSN